MGVGVGLRQRAEQVLKAGEDQPATEECVFKNR